MWHFRCKNCPAKEQTRCETCEVQRFVDDCRAAIDLIGWYLHGYHHADFGHEDMIAELQSIVEHVQREGRINPVHREIFHDIESRVDRWLYQLI